ncbi:MAG: shikimate kinase [Rickettsiales bacterium]
MEMSKQSTIVLVGLMGAGKSTIGRRLAAKMGVDFKDSDDEIADAAGCSISDLFAIHGEAIFRDLEQRVIVRLLSDGIPKVLATGGGAWMNPKVRDVIGKSATSVWLRAEIDVLIERVGRKNTRPLLEKGDKRAILQKLMDERYPIYQEADIVVDSDNGAHETIVDMILNRVQPPVISSEQTQHANG